MSIPPKTLGRALIVIALGSLVLRLFPFFRTGGVFGHPIDYDEGVYFSASALLFQGVLPYRDFVFVHPPGLLYVVGTVTSWAARVDVATAFAATRIAAALVGALNTWLVGRAAARWSGANAGIVAAALYATYSEVVKAERGPFLDPVLNLLCVTLALVWLGRPTPGFFKSVVAGAVCGAACAVKLWGGIWLIAALAALPASNRWRHAGRFVGAAAATWLILVFPLAMSAPAEFIGQTLQFQLFRPPDGIIIRAARLTEIVSVRHLFASVLGLLGLFMAVVNAPPQARREARFYVTAYVGTLLAFMVSSSYFKEYNAHLATSECVLAGFGACSLWRLGHARIGLRLRRRVLVAAPLVMVLGSAAVAVMASSTRAPNQLQLREMLRARVADSDCLFTFDPAATLLGGRLPPVTLSRIAVDPYGGMLVDAVRQGARYMNAGAAFEDAASQSEIEKLLDRCRFVVMGDRGWWQLSASSEATFRRSHERIDTQAEPGPDVWELSNR